MLILLAVCLLVVVLGFGLLGVHQRNANREIVNYQITLPPFGAVNADPISLYKVIGELVDQSSGKLWEQRHSVALEIIASGNSGTGFYISAPKAIAGVIKNYLIAYSPRARITKTKKKNLDFLLQRWKIRAWRWDGGTDTIDQPVEYVIAGMRGLKTNETVAFQLVIGPSRRGPLKEVVMQLAVIIFKLIRLLIVTGLYLMLDEESLAKKRRAMLMASKEKTPKGELSVSIRSAISSINKKRLNKLDASLTAALRSYGLKQKRVVLHIVRSFDRKLIGSPSKISAQRVASLFYLPEGINNNLAEVETSGSMSLATPTRILRKGETDVILGLSDFNGDKTALSLSASERQKHLLILGGTGMGKSTLLGTALLQDIISGKGAALVDPHGDLSKQILKLIPTKRIKDVIYIDPKDIAFPVGINLMELPQGLSEEDEEVAKDFVTEAIVSIFRKIFSDDDSGGHRIEYILRNTIHTAFNVPGATLFTLHKLLTNDTFRAGIVSKLSDEGLRDFWYGEFNKAGSYQRVKMIAGVTSKLGRFQRSVVTRRMLEQPHSTIDFDDLINKRKILICNFAKGSIGEDTSSLLGMVVLAKLQLAAWHRALTIERLRKPFYIYVDEFQTFASHTLSQLVSESRKYGICMTMAEQTTANQEDKDVNILLSNTGNIICFRSAAPIDTKRLLPMFAPKVSDIDLGGLEPYRFYMRVSSETTREPLSGITLPIVDRGSSATYTKVINASRKNFSKKYIKPKDNIPGANQMERVPMKTRDSQ